MFTKTAIAGISIYHVGKWLLDEPSSGPYLAELGMPPKAILSIAGVFEEWHGGSHEMAAEAAVAAEVRRVRAELNRLRSLAGDAPAEPAAVYEELVATVVPWIQQVAGPSASPLSRKRKTCWSGRSSRLLTRWSTRERTLGFIELDTPRTVTGRAQPKSWVLATASA